MKVLIVEDEMPSARKLKNFLAELEPGYEVMDILDTVAESVDFLSKNRPDLIFLDIHLADGNSFEIFEQIELHIPIIFTTAYDQYAIEAFEQRSISYLLKPLSKEQLAKALQKFKLYYKENRKFNYQALEDPEDDQERPINRFMVHFRDALRSIKVADVAYFYAADKAVYLCTVNNKRYALNFSLDQLEKRLPADQFFRANRKTLLSIDAVVEARQYSKNKLWVTVSPGADEDIVISAEKAAKFKRWMAG